MSEGTPKGYAFSDAWNLFKKTTLKLAPAIIVISVIQIALEMYIGPIGQLLSSILTAYLTVMLIHAVSGFTKNQPINLLASAQHTVKNTVSLIVAYIVIFIPIVIVTVLVIGAAGGITMIEGFANAGATAGGVKAPADAALSSSADAIRQQMEDVQLLIGATGIIFLALLYFFVRFYTLAVVIVENNVGPITAIKQAWSQTKGYFWDTFLMALCVIAVTILVVLVVGVLIYVVAMILPEDIFTIVAIVLAVIPTIILYPLGVAAITIQKQKLDLVKGQARTAQPTQQTGPTDSSSNL